MVWSAFKSRSNCIIFFLLYYIRHGLTIVHCSVNILFLHAEFRVTFVGRSVSLPNGNDHELWTTVDSVEMPFWVWVRWVQGAMY